MREINIDRMKFANTNLHTYRLGIDGITTILLAEIPRRH